MKKSYQVLFIVLLSSLLVFPQYKSLEKNTPGKVGSYNCYQKKISVKELVDIGKSNKSISHSFDVLNYKIYVDLYNCYLSPYPKNYSGIVTIKFKADSVLNYISLNAVNTSMQIDSVKSAGVSFTHTSDILKINLNRTYNPNDTAEVIIYYKHKNVSDGAFYASNGFVFTDCEPEGARKWFPCYDRPSDKATLDLTARTPASVKLGSNGRLADSTKTGDTIYYHWVSRDQIATYLITMASKVNYNLDVFYWTKPSNGEQVPMRFYYNSGESAASYESTFLNMATFYSNTFTEHPFEKNGFAALNSQFSWGGMENQTLTTICPGCWETSLIAHEFAHQWFGDMITCETWADIWLNEGFATFIEALWDEHTSGYSAYKSNILSNANGYMGSNPGFAISNPDWAVNTPDVNTLFNYAITYEKGACVVHLLRYVLGDSTFFAFIKSYANDPQFRFNSATIQKFKNKLNTFTGQDYGWFFDEWIYQPNHPSYSNQYYFEQYNGGWTTGFRARQTNSYFYTMPIEIKVNYNDGSNTIYRVMNTYNNQPFFFTSTKQPVSVEFDPNNNIVIKNATLSVTSPFPVELTSFTAQVKDNFVVLNWNTATEMNNKGFEIYRAKFNAEGLPGSYEKIGFVNGNGTTTTPNSYSFTAYNSEYGKYAYKLKQIDFSGKFEYSGAIYVTSGTTPTAFSLKQNYPNPFNPQTLIQFELPKDSYIKLSVYNSLGQLVKVLAEGSFEAGKHIAKFDGNDLASGMYIYELKADNTVLRNKMILQK